MPTATASENRTASMTGRPSATLTTKIVTLSTPPTLASRPEKRVRPSWNSVWGCRSPSPTAIRPNWVARPVATTTASAEPSCTTVPMNRHDDSSASAAPLATGSGDFAAGTDSPVRIDSSHSRLLAASSRTSAGTIEPTPRCTMSPGTRCVTSTLAERAVADDGDEVADLRVHRLGRTLGPVLVDEAEADRRGDDHADDERRRVPRRRTPTPRRRRAAATAAGCSPAEPAPPARWRGGSAPRSGRTSRDGWPPPARSTRRRRSRGGRAPGRGSSAAASAAPSGPDAVGVSGSGPDMVMEYGASSGHPPRSGCDDRTLFPSLRPGPIIGK